MSAVSLYPKYIKSTILVRPEDPDNKKKKIKENF